MTSTPRHSEAAFETVIEQNLLGHGYVADAAAALRRLLRLDPADHLRARENLAAIDAGKTWREMETAP